MIKLLILQPNLICGGVERSLVNFLNKLDYSKYQVDLLLRQYKGNLIDEIPKNVNIINAKTEERIPEKYKKQSWIKKIICKCRDFVIKYLSFIYYLKIDIEAKKTFKRNKDFLTDYDYLIVFHGLSFFSLKMMDKIVAKKKIAICHGDVRFANKVSFQAYLKFYKDLDSLFFVSKSCMNLFNDLYSHYKVHTDFAYNIQDENEIKEKSSLFEIEYSKEHFNIISVSRLSKVKGLIRSLQAFKNLHDKGYDFIWHIVGDGILREEIEIFIKNNNMSQYVKLYGNQRNPYPYIKSADLFYLGSFHEAAPMVINEAFVLNCPFLTTQTISSEELIKDYGFICDNSLEGIEEKFIELLDNKELVLEKRKKLQNFKIDSSQDMLAKLFK